MQRLRRGTTPEGRYAQKQEKRAAGEKGWTEALPEEEGGRLSGAPVEEGVELRLRRGSAEAQRLDLTEN
eukprot:3214778-Rhodomonas_salina.1